MFHAIAERKVRQVFASLSDGDYEPALEGLAPGFEHVFAGDHALGGARHTVEGLRAWFQRLYRLFPDLGFEISSMSVSGPPWDMTVVAEWIDRATPAGGGTYENHGTHIVRLAWGKLVSIHAYLDTQVLAESLRVMAANGLEEAVAMPIVDTEERGARGRQTRRSHPDRARAVGARALGAVAGASATSYLGVAALGALATGALAIGALAIGRVAIGRLSLGRTRISRLEIDELIVRRSSVHADSRPLRSLRPRC
ncbi:MAG: nuclear transport factor 2 family protein [Proteobacteria bacterium]|nr:nuclear transport factor 2 family protein [Burkholderiales bacterium]